ncbi:hypothetical protein [Magnetovibrio blakemorei]|uniref:Uncharacterized protein n=1 Tax=Magnetovibrio blakemorei TaxID=28181 RepID=A0A1E5Q9A9_9PROT|nr:hypothetical protein [Magnetovibrio blakemorei]OEJ68090.1 hypothetical protein BEN30_07475 [Magnetovibrio blakemorei]
MGGILCVKAKGYHVLKVFSKSQFFADFALGPKKGEGAAKFAERPLSRSREEYWIPWMSEKRT